MTLVAFWKDDAAARSEARTLSRKYDADVLELETQVPYDQDDAVNRCRLRFEALTGIAPLLSRRTRVEAAAMLGCCGKVFAVSSDFGCGRPAPAVRAFLNMAETRAKEVTLCM